MDDNTIVDTENAVAHWEESTRWDGRNHISVNTGSQWCHQTLYRSRKGRYYIVHTSQWQGSTPRAEWVSNYEAARWLIANDESLPDNLAELAEQIVE
jgi:hypothetical protein